jgi:hypothetical protein
MFPICTLEIHSDCTFLYSILNNTQLIHTLVCMPRIKDAVVSEVEVQANAERPLISR